MLTELRKAATEIAQIGGKHTLNYFKQDIEIITKEDDSPVTIADRETEEILREEITKRYPDHGIIGEEFGRTNENSSIKWVLDPIDGTQSFIHGIPLYTTLIGILIDNEPQVGIIYAPALDEVCSAAIGHGVTLNGKECKTRNTTSLSEATFLVTDLYRFQEYNQQDLYQALMEKSKLHRSWGDAYGHMMVAIGRADLMYDPEMSIWDAAALLPVVKEAGGIFCDNTGNETIHTGNGISVGKELYPEVKQLFDSHLNT